VHGSPDDDTIGLLETSTSQGLRVASEVEIAARLEGEGARLVLCGHTHVPRMHRRLSGQLILCPGSVHRPLIMNNPALPCAGADASCFAVATDATGRWEGELIVIDGERGTRRYTTVTA
jgi:predicted phosphodiesterase